VEVIDLTNEDDGTTTWPIRAWVVDVKRGEAPVVMRKVLDAASAAGVDVLVSRRDMVFGRDHVASAVEHASRAIREGRNASESLPMETLLYLSGERQLSSAIGKMAVGEDTTLMVVAQLSPGPSLAERSWTELPRLDSSIEPSRLKGFGVSEKELGTVGPGREAELVLERVASVDVTKR
jgi:KEOPS complex subunit Cgi121